MSKLNYMIGYIQTIIDSIKDGSSEYFKHGTYIFVDKDCNEYTFDDNTLVYNNSKDVIDSLESLKKIAKVLVIRFKDGDQRFFVDNFVVSYNKKLHSFNAFLMTKDGYSILSE